MTRHNVHIEIDSFESDDAEGEGYQMYVEFPPEGGGEEGQPDSDFQESGTVEGVVKYVEKMLERHAPVPWKKARRHRREGCR